jgi:membrane protease YdiL (CAAX protease family)
MLVATLSTNALLNALGISPQASAAPGLERSSWRFLVYLRAGVVEEILFRGYAITRAARITGSTVIAFVLPLLVFVGVHYQAGLIGLVYVLVLGTLLAASFAWRKNIKMNIIAHTLTNMLLAG